ncbi:hypothetical protein A4D02_09850 [Niastella koreensis]|uniref:Secreted protein n=1 Tax=Niastella koreensis TaxID=354356 RepID=A0ABX3NSF8_9BACT|nr:hypothetical protein A4D02_09850 [Niastella koreensis]
MRNYLYHQFITVYALFILVRHLTAGTSSNRDIWKKTKRGDKNQVADYKIIETKFQSGRKGFIYVKK